MVGTPPPLCNSPMLEINGTRAPHPVASQADAYLFQVRISRTGCLGHHHHHHDHDHHHHQVKSGGTVQFCKIVCDKGEWRGPYCGQTRERLGGYHHHHHCHHHCHHHLHPKDGHYANQRRNTKAKTTDNQSNFLKEQASFDNHNNHDPHDNYDLHNNHDNHDHDQSECSATVATCKLQCPACS